MNRELTRSLELSCPSCGGSKFELRVLGDEGLAAAHCVGCSRDFLVLDSEDYWIDTIQATVYPRPRRCSCKATSFNLRCDYFYRDAGDVRSVDLWSVCPSCGKTKHQMSIDVDYGDTDDLVKRALRFCRTPNLRYDLKEISLYLAKADMASVVGYLNSEHRCAFVCWLRENDNWVMRTLDAQEVQQAILSDQYLRIYASLIPLVSSEPELASARQEECFWKRHEVIRISSPTSMQIGQEKGLLYYIRYSNEYVESDTVVQKPADFRATTEALLQWLDARFVSWRGRLCFDNASENIRLFGDRFSKKRASVRHR